MHKTDLYFESHITIEPVFDERLEALKVIVENYGFKVADLLFKKRKEDTPIRSSYDTFCTSRDKDYNTILNNTMDCVSYLEYSEFKVWRYKIENTLVDVRTK